MRSLCLIAVIAVLSIAHSADAQGPLRRLLFGNRFAAPSCSGGQCEVMPAPAVAPVQLKAVCSCGKAECPLCCPDGKCCEVPGVVGEPVARALDPKSFAGVAQKQLSSAPRGLMERHYLRILNGKDSPMRTRQLARMERLVRAELDLSPTQAIDWSAIDWAAVLRFLLTVLPLFL